MNSVFSWKGCVLVVLLVAVGGCGIGEQRSINQFSGTWSLDEGSVMEGSCDGESFTDDMTGNTTISEGADADLVMEDAGCNWEFDVEGKEAKGHTGQSCSWDGDDGLERTLRWTRYTMELDDETLEFDATGTMTFRDDDGDELDCSIDYIGSQSKVSD